MSKRKSRVQRATAGSSPKTSSVWNEFLELTEGGGEVGQLLRVIDWDRSPVGPFETWPQSLKTALSICLASKFPMFVWWGKDLVVFYNDSYIPLAGPAKHPQFLGRPACEQWSEIWDALRPLTEQVVQTSNATWAESMELFVSRKGFLEEAYFTFSYSPIRDETGAVGGIINPCQETTERILGERRLKTLHDLGVEEIQNIADVGPFAAKVLGGNTRDVPFALLYLTDQQGSSAYLAGSTGIAPNTAAAPEALSLALTPSVWQAWPICQMLEKKQAQRVDGLRALFHNDLPGTPYAEMPDSAYMLPVLLPGRETPAGFLILGVSPRLAFDDAYQAFFGLITKHIATHISNVRALEQEKKRAEALAELDRAKTAFFSNVSHEFRTPLTLMLGPLEDLINAGAALPATLRSEAEVAHHNATRLLKLVNTLLDFSRIEAGRISAMFQPTDLSKLTTDLASVFRSAIEKAGLRLVVDCPALDEPVYVDRDMWEKMVLNLLSNAFKFTFHGEIRVSQRQAGRKLQLSVSDTGAGIPAEELPRIFERFHRVEGARGRAYEGTGIGLALVNELVKLHAGCVGVESAIGEGATFTVEIPLGIEHLPADRIGQARQLNSTATREAYVEEALRWLPDDIEQASAASAVLDLPDVPVSDGSSRSCILLADDNSDMRAYVRRLLACRYEVITANDGQAAFEIAIRRLPDAVLTDVMMPHLNGFELLARLRADSRTATIPVIMLSARAGEESRVEGLTAGADDYLVKPFSARELLARVDANLTLAKARHQAARQAAELETAKQRERLRAEQLLREQSLRAEAEAANRLKDEFIATISHELRTPLTAIHGWTQMLQKDNLDDSTRRRAVEVIARNTKIQMLLIEDLLDVSRILTGKMKLNVDQVDLAPMVDDLIHSARLSADAKQIAVHKAVDPNAGTVLGDPDRLRQIILNLLNNAIKFTPHGGEVQITLRRVDSLIELSVADTGRGITPDFLPHIFERFRQADGSTTREHGGLGLGLAIVKSLVELHGGTVDATSQGEGKGATFTVRIPLLDVQEEYAGQQDNVPLQSAENSKT